MQGNKKLFKLIHQFIKFGIVGVGNTCLSLAFYYGLYYLGIHYLLANAVGFIAGVVNSYYWNSRYVFERTNKDHIVPFVKTFLCYGFTFLASTFFLYIMVDYLSINALLAPLINLLITVPMNFLLNKYWAFK